MMETLETGTSSLETRLIIFPTKSDHYKKMVLKSSPDLSCSKEKLRKKTNLVQTLTVCNRAMYLISVNLNKQEKRMFHDGEIHTSFY